MSKVRLFLLFFVALVCKNIRSCIHCVNRILGHARLEELWPYRLELTKSLTCKRQGFSLMIDSLFWFKKNEKSMNGIIIFVWPNFNRTVTATFIRSYSSLLDLINSFKPVVNCRQRPTEKYNINRKLLA